MTFRCLTVLACVLLATTTLPAQDSAITTLKSARKSTPQQNQAAMKQLAQSGAAGLIPILEGMKDTDPVASNWLRAAFEASASKVIKNGEKLPVELTAFIKNSAGDGRARRLAYEWLMKADPTIKKLIPSMLFDPMPDFRRDAIELLIAEGTKQLANGKKDAAKQTFEKALSAAIHDDQVKKIVAPLKELGNEVNLQKHFGFLPEWSVVGPFDNKDGIGFAAVYPPEKKIDLGAEIEVEGKDASGKVKWKKLTTDDDYGNINIAKQIENFKGSCMYATTEFQSDGDRVLEMRLATPNAWKLWVNGEMIFGREEYHRTPNSLLMDVYRVPVKLKAGANRILLKVCQNEQKQDWAQRYQFNVRVCDETGTAVRESAVRKSASAR